MAWCWVRPGKTRRRSRPGRSTRRWTGCPLAIEAFSGATGAPSPLQAQVEKLRRRFGLSRVLLVGDRGMITGARIREDLLAATERGLSRIAMATQRKRQPLRGKARIGLEVGKIIDKHKMAKPSEPTITDDSFAFQRREVAIAAEARLDGLYHPLQRAPRDNEG